METIIVADMNRKAAIAFVKGKSCGISSSYPTPKEMEEALHKALTVLGGRKSFLIRLRDIFEKKEPNAIVEIQRTVDNKLLQEKAWLLGIIGVVTPLEGQVTNEVSLDALCSTFVPAYVHGSKS